MSIFPCLQPPPAPPCLQASVRSEVRAEKGKGFSPLLSTPETLSQAGWHPAAPLRCRGSAHRQALTLTGIQDEKVQRTHHRGSP